MGEADCYMVSRGFLRRSRRSRDSRIRTEDLKSYKKGVPTFSSGVVTSSEKQCRQRVAAVVEAERALGMDFFQRRKEFAFASRFSGKWGKYFDWSQGEEEKKT